MVEAGADGVGGEGVVDVAACHREAVTQEQGMAGAGGQILEVMGHQNAGEIDDFAAQLIDAPEQLFPGGEIESGCRLVEQQQ